MNQNYSYKRSKRGFFFLFIVAAFFALSAVVMWLWNALLPEIFQLPFITYWQAMGLLVLSRILFGGFHFRGKSHRPPYGNPMFREKFMSMSDEEKARFKEQWRERCGKR